MTGRGWPGYLVWGLLAYGLTKAVVDIAAWLGMRVPVMGETVLYGIMLVVAARLLVQVYEDSEKSS